MNTPTTRILTPARLVALALIGLSVLALAYLRFAPEGDSIVGAWLGFNATEVPIALLTAILGAAVGANVTLLALDIAWDRQARDRSAATTAKETLEARRPPLEPAAPTGVGRH